MQIKRSKNSNSALRLNETSSLLYHHYYHYYDCHQHERLCLLLFYVHLMRISDGHTPDFAKSRFNKVSNFAISFGIKAPD